MTIKERAERKEWLDNMVRQDLKLALDDKYMSKVIVNYPPLNLLV